MSMHLSFSPKVFKTLNSSNKEQHFELKTTGTGSGGGEASIGPTVEQENRDEENQIAWLRGHSGRDPRLEHLDIMGSDEDPREYDNHRRLFLNGLKVAEIFGFMACFLIILWVFLYAGGHPGFGEGFKPVNLHIILMVVFMFYLHGHAAIIYRVYPHKPKFKVKCIHAGIHLTVVIASAVGLLAAVVHHDIGKTPHFYSFHSWLGLTAIIIYYGQFLGGFTAFLLPVTPVRIRTLVLPFHQFCGQAAFSFCTGSVISGIMLKAIGTISDYSQQITRAGMLINFGGFFAILFSIAVGSLLGDYRFRRRPRPEGELLLADAHADAE